MAPLTLLNIAVPITILNARTGTGASNTFALPTRACILEWETSFDIAPGAIDIDIDVSMDNVLWTTIDNSTAVGGETQVIADPTAALFIRANVKINTGNRKVTLMMVAKVANP